MFAFSSTNIFIFSIPRNATHLNVASSTNLPSLASQLVDDFSPNRTGEVLCFSANLTEHCLFGFKTKCSKILDIVYMEAANMFAFFCYQHRHFFNACSFTASSLPKPKPKDHFSTSHVFIHSIVLRRS